MKTRQSSNVTRGAYMVGLALRAGRATAVEPEAQPYRYACLLALMLAACVLAFAGRIHAAGTGTLDYVSGWYPSGTNLTVTATPHLYSQFDYWAGDTNGASVADNQIGLTVFGDMMVTAVFRDGITASNAVPYIWLGDQGISNNFEVAVTNDHDGDGFTTAEEYWSGTDPMQTESHLRLDSVELLGADVRLMWQHARVDSNNIPPICVQSRASMATGEWGYASEKLPEGGVNILDLPLGAQRFYRLCVTNMP